MEVNQTFRGSPLVQVSKENHLSQWENLKLSWLPYLVHSMVLGEQSSRNSKKDELLQTASHLEPP